MRIIDGFQLFCCVSTDKRGPYTTQNMVQPVYDYPRRYTAKQLKTIYYPETLHLLLRLQLELEEEEQDAARLAVLIREMVNASV